MIDQVAIETVKKGAQVVAPFDGVLVTVKAVKNDGDSVVLVVGVAFCLEIRQARGSLVNVYRRPRRRKAKEDGE